MAEGDRNSAAAAEEGGPVWVAAVEVATTLEVEEAVDVADSEAVVGEEAAGAAADDADAHSTRTGDIIMTHLFSRLFLSAAVVTSSFVGITSAAHAQQKFPT